jgi:hypothetical protein
MILAVNSLEETPSWRDDLACHLVGLRTAARDGVELSQHLRRQRAHELLKRLVRTLPEMGFPIAGNVGRGQRGLPCVRSVALLLPVSSSNELAAVSGFVAGRLSALMHTCQARSADCEG